MPLSTVVGLVRDRLTAAGISGLPPVDGVAPAAPTDVPHITVSVSDAVPGFRGLGELPAPPQTGSLRVEADIDLADPVLHVPGEDVPLLSADGRTLQLPHGAVVRESGDDLAPFATTDLLVRLGATTFAPVHATPAAGQVQLDIPSGALTFASPLPSTGTLELGYFVALWEVRVERFTANVLIDIAHNDVDDQFILIEASEAALRADQWPASEGVRSIEPVALSPSVPIAGLPAANRTCRLTYHADVEVVEPVIPSSGGPIRRIEFVARPPLAEQFAIGAEPGP
jgi:hypothetical protein